MSEYEDAVVQAVRERIRDVPDFPKPGIVFKDLTPVFSHGPTFRQLIDAYARRYSQMNVDAFVGIEARGFITGGPVAAQLEKGFHLLRKRGKLPWKTVSQSYDLEYGQDALEMHQDAVRPGERVVIMDDLLATGGTMRAAIDLLEGQGAEVVETCVVVELGFLGGRSRLSGTPTSALIEL